MGMVHGAVPDCDKARVRLAVRYAQITGSLHVVAGATTVTLQDLRLVADGQEPADPLAWQLLAVHLRD
jgi:hypothetical protein